MMRKYIKYAALLSAQLLVFSYFGQQFAEASTFLEGKNITTAFYFPNQSTIGFGGIPVETTVGPGVEIGGSPQGYPIASIDFSDTSIELDFFRNLVGTVAPFNGWRFYDANNTIPEFTDAILTMSNTTGWVVSFDADNIWLNGSGSVYFDSSTLRIDVSTVPVPAAGLLLGSGLAWLAGARLRKKRLNN